MTKVIRYAREEGHRPHRWREQVVATYRAARQAWEELREYATHGYLHHRSAESRARSIWGHARFTDEHAEFLAHHPPPTLRSILEGLAGEADSWG